MAELTDQEISAKQRQAKRDGLAEAVRQGLTPEQVQAMTFAEVAALCGVAVPALDIEGKPTTDYEQYGILPKHAQRHIADELAYIRAKPERLLARVANVVRGELADSALPIELQPNGDIIIHTAQRVEGRGIVGYNKDGE